MRPSHGDYGVCINCGEDVEYWDGNPGGHGAHWYHTAITNGRAQFCYQSEAEV